LENYVFAVASAYKYAFTSFYVNFNGTYFLGFPKAILRFYKHVNLKVHWYESLKNHK